MGILINTTHTNDSLDVCYYAHRCYCPLGHQVGNISSHSSTHTPSHKPSHATSHAPWHHTSRTPLLHPLTLLLFPLTHLSTGDTQLSTVVVEHQQFLQNIQNDKVPLHLKKHNPIRKKSVQKQSPINCNFPCFDCFHIARRPGLS